jgi:hypothetical protein
MQDRVRFSDHSWIRGSGWPVGSSETLPSRPFFIVGNPRSGTTLFRSILSCHPDVFIPPENGALGDMMRVFLEKRAQPWTEMVSAVLAAFREAPAFEFWQVDLEEVRKAAEALPAERRSLAGLIDGIYAHYGSVHAPGKRRWADKSAGFSTDYLHRLALVFPQALFIHVVRDGRDSIVSNVKAGYAQKSYLRAAFMWKDNVRRCHRFGKQLRAQNRFFEFRYEDLISATEKTVSAVCRFLDLEPTESMLHYQGASAQLPDAFMRPLHQNVTKPIFQDSIGKWRTEIPQSEWPVLMKVMRKELSLFNYE